MTASQPIRPTNKAGKEIAIVVDVPRLIFISYFNATSKGIQDAARELGNDKAKRATMP
jgi:rhamnose transport system substrate-binding protein